MKKKIFFVFIFLIQTFQIELFPSPDKFNRYFIDSAKKAKPSVVNISIYIKKKLNNKINYRKVADASGTIITKLGHVITNYHVVKKGNYYQITDIYGSKFELGRFSNGKFFLADLKTDIAVLKIDNTDNFNFRPIKFADSNKLSVGEWVIAIGNPYGLKQSITSGIISSIGRDNIGFTDIEDFIQTDVSINPGNSGGPLINLHGEMIGINTAIRTVTGGYQGISFSIPSNIVKLVYNELIKYKRVRRGWLGFLVREKKINTRSDNRIIEIISILKRSPAFNTGLQKGDVIKKIDNNDVNTLGKLIKLIGKKPIGSMINITISRNGKLFNYTIALREKKEYKKIRRGLRELFLLYGIDVDENAETGNIIVSYVSPNSLSYGLKKGDIIISINGLRIKSLEDFIMKFNRLKMKIKQMKIYRNSKIFKVQFNNNTYIEY